MESIDVREAVRRAVAMEWPAFVTSHPRLAEVLDESLVMESAIASLADDPEYEEAMATADAVGAGAEAVANVVQKFVANWLRQLV